jgi:phenylacetate-coenzyme A ligase PaaK-like adenylate-forming protein
MKPDYRDIIFNIKDQEGFLSSALEAFSFQYENNKVYRDFVNKLRIDKNSICSLENIPFMPIEFFRNHNILSGDPHFVKIFESSRTTGSVPSRHLIKDISLYEESFLRAFNLFYGNPSEYFILALLPSYVEREGSSLVYMVDRLIKESNYPPAGFYKDNINELIDTINNSPKSGRKILLLGVSYALLDIAEKLPVDLSGAIVMETGGMKGKRKEITRQELHSFLKSRFGTGSIHSEYGMTELLSQAYSKADGVFYCPPWMKVLIRDPLDPLTIYNEPGVTGGINIIDLANINSCVFIATGDLGRIRKDGGFEVLGRFDNSDIRGCNLMAV